MNHSEGYLQIRASAADQALPVCDAVVEVLASDAETTLLTSAKTNCDGLSPVFSLPAPPIENSDSPNDPQAYTAYIVRISHPNYGTVRVNEVAVFPGIPSTLPVSLTPISDGAPNGTTVVEGETGPSGAGTEN